LIFDFVASVINSIDRLLCHSLQRSELYSAKAFAN